MLLGGPDGGPHHGPGGAVDAARQVDRHNRAAGSVHRVDRGERVAGDRPVEPGAEQRIDDDGGAGEIGVAWRPRRPTRRSASAASPLMRSRAPTRNRLDPDTGVAQMACRDKAVAAIIAGARRPPRPCCPAGGARSTACATAAPAFSMRTAPGMPDAMVRRSASRHLVIGEKFNHCHP